MTVLQCLFHVMFVVWCYCVAVMCTRGVVVAVRGFGGSDVLDCCDGRVLSAKSSRKSSTSCWLRALRI
jgi:hypothetical protein